MSNIKKLFCVKCGTQLVEEWRGEYECETGNKEYILVCPNACLHGSHLDETIRQGWFSRTERCKRCGRLYKWNGSGGFP